VVTRGAGASVERAAEPGTKAAGARAVPAAVHRLVRIESSSGVVWATTGAVRREHGWGGRSTVQAWSTTGAAQHRHGRGWRGAGEAGVALNSPPPPLRAANRRPAWRWLRQSAPKFGFGAWLELLNLPSSQSSLDNSIQVSKNHRNRGNRAAAQHRQHLVWFSFLLSFGRKQGQPRCTSPRYCYHVRTLNSEADRAAGPLEPSTKIGLPMFR
jgi:hypothetical protein